MKYYPLFVNPSEERVRELSVNQSSNQFELKVIEYDQYPLQVSYSVFLVAFIIGILSIIYVNSIYSIASTIARIAVATFILLLVIGLYALIISKYYDLYLKNGRENAKTIWSKIYNVNTIKDISLLVSFSEDPNLSELLGTEGYLQGDKIEKQGPQELMDSDHFPSELKFMLPVYIDTEGGLCALLPWDLYRGYETFLAEQNTTKKWEFTELYLDTLSLLKYLNNHYNLSSDLLISISK